MEQRGAEHPDLVDLEALRTGEGLPEHAVHLARCEECRHATAVLERLRAGLEPSAEPPFAVPVEVDERILWNARKRASRARRSATPWMRPAAWAAAAAIAIAAVTTLRPAVPDSPQAEHASRVASRRPVGAADVDGDGRLDILDAFALARALKQQRQGTDVDGDGDADGRDVDALARRAVALVQG